MVLRSGHVFVQKMGKIKKRQRTRLSFLKRKQDQVVESRMLTIDGTKQGRRWPVLLRDKTGDGKTTL